MRIRSFTLGLAASLCSLAALLAFASAPALAKTVHVYSSSFTGSGATALSDPTGIAVNNTTGDVYVVDKGHNRVEEFNSTGSTVLAEFNGAASPTGPFSEPEGIAVDNSGEPLTDESAGDVYVVDAAHKVIDKFSSEGQYIGQLTTGSEGHPFGALNGVAVDQHGTVWVYLEKEEESGEIDSFNDALANGFLSARLSQAEGQKPGFAVDSEDNLYVAHNFRPRFEKLNSAGEELNFGENFGGESTKTGIAVDLSDDDVYLDEEGVAVSEFAAAGLSIETFGSGHLTGGGGVAVNYSTGNASSGTVYVADSAGNDVAVFPSGVIPDVTVEPVSSFPSTTSATLKGAVNPDGTSVTGCEFEYGIEPGVLTGKAPCAPAPPFSGSAPVAVSASATGLTQGETYYYRLSATNATGTSSSSEQSVFQPFAVTIEGESATSVEATEATLEAEIDPGGAATAYHFEYGPAAGSYDVSVPIPDREIAVGRSDVSVRVVAKGLQPGSTYHYRVVASNGLPGAVDGVDQTFTTLVPPGTGSPPSCANAQARAEQPYALGLPDCRAYEMVSPLDKGDSAITTESARAAVSGEAVVYASLGSFGEPAGAKLESRYISRRGSDRWSTQNIGPPTKDANEFYENPSPFSYLLFTPELSKGVLSSSFTSLTDTPEGYVNIYVADLENGSYEDATPGIPEQNDEKIRPYQELPFPQNTEPELEGASTDLSHVVFRQQGGLTPESSGEGENIYLYEWVDGRLRSVGIAPDGVPFGGGPFGASESFDAISSDGSRVLFKFHGQIYVRENAEQSQSPMNGKEECEDLADACTIQVSAGGAQYQAASADGTKVFYTEGEDLYEDSLPVGQLSGQTTAITTGGKVQGVVQISEVGSYVYFVAEGKLATGAVEGKPNLYVYNGGETTFIASLAGGDQLDWTGKLASHTARVTPDGTHLAFESEQRLTGYDNEPAEPGECENNRCREVYLYGVGSSSHPPTLVCASCNPSGARPIGPSQLGGARSKFYASHNLTEDGSRLFFQSTDALVPHDSNGQVNVFEYESGAVYAISDVAGGYPSYFMDASPSGDDVFITTADQLLRSDTDTRVDIYDARVGGGFPVAPAPPECDNADSCKPPESPQPAVFGAPVSATFSGPGNPPPPPAVVKPVVKKKTVTCKRGYVKKKVKNKEECVRKKSKAKKSSKSKRGDKS